MENGYIKLYRSSLKKGWLQNPKLWAFWCWCLMKASHSEHKQIVGHQAVDLLPGQFVFGLKAASKELKQSIQSIRTHLKFCTKVDQNLTVKTTNKFSIITIVNWDSYQVDKEQPNKQNNNQLTNKQQTTNKQLTTNKNDKNGKKEKNSILLSLFNEFYSTYPKKVGREAALKAWLKNGDVITSEYETIIASLKKQIPLWTEKQFIPNPATWINGKRWNDELIQRESLSKKCKEDEMLREFD